MLRAIIIGGTGYTGGELLRLLLPHPCVEVVAVSSRAEAGRPITDVFPHLSGATQLEFVEPTVELIESCDVAFFATPHGVAQSMVGDIDLSRVKIIDLSADFRIKDVPLWERWYGQPHQAVDKLKQAVYGLPELYRADIEKASLIACAGCYPTSVLLGFMPLLKEGCIETSDLIANSASGVSGAGKSAKEDLLFGELNDSFKAYGAAGHRHLPEIRHYLSQISGSEVGLTFVPHLLPIIRGIHSTLYCKVKEPAANLQAIFESAYADEPFVEVLPAGQHPQTRRVKGTNRVQIAVHRPEGGDTAVILVVEDNLTKGASGQAVQCMNITFGFDELTGLQGLAMAP